MDNKSKKELREDLVRYTDLFHKSQAEIRRLLANPPETIQRVIVEHKPLPVPVRGVALWEDPSGYPVFRIGASLLLPETFLDFTPAQLGIECVEKDLTHSQFRLRIRWEMR